MNAVALWTKPVFVKKKRKRNGQRHRDATSRNCEGCQRYHTDLVVYLTSDLTFLCAWCFNGDHFEPDLITPVRINNELRERQYADYVWIDVPTPPPEEPKEKRPKKKRGPYKVKPAKQEPEPKPPKPPKPPKVINFEPPKTRTPRLLTNKRARRKALANVPLRDRQLSAPESLTRCAHGNSWKLCPACGWS